jgi:uncharacterized protein
MSNLFEPLTDKEFERLDRFLLERLDDDTDTEGKDEGVLDISELDGLFTALVSGPEVVVPSRWFPVVWGAVDPVWESENAFKDIITLMMRHMNSIAAMLMEHPEIFEPIYLERKVKAKTFTIVDEWCEGYRRGVELVEEQWNAGGEEMAALLAPVFAFTARTNWRGHDLPSDEVELIKKAIAPKVREIHAYWLARRAEPPAPASPVRRSEPRVGRNDPCPCGSGKKYKKCCLH